MSHRATQRPWHEPHITSSSSSKRRGRGREDSENYCNARCSNNSRRSPPVRSRSRSSSVISDTEIRDDSAGLLEFNNGDIIKDRYKVLGLAGQGTFGTVLDVFDKKRFERVAMKVVRSVKRYLEAAYVEIDILDKIRTEDRDKSSLCVRLFKSFETHHRNRRHVCIVFEKLGKSLYDCIKRNNYQGFDLPQVRDFARQLIQAVKFCHSIDLIHTDLKPENILLVNNEFKKVMRGRKEFRMPVSTAIRLIDFGGATFDNEHHARMVNTRQYRAPEVILGLGWSFPSDMWSVGCILAELLTGELLFGTHEDSEHLALMEHVLGAKFPTRMTRTAIHKCRAESNASRNRHRSKRNRRRSTSTPRADMLFNDDTGELAWPAIASSRDSVRHVHRAKKLSDLVKDPLFLDLLKRLLTFDPEKRITAEDAFNHPFLTEYEVI